MHIDSEPYFTKFSPDVIPYQREVCDLISVFDFGHGNLEILLSGSFGSAKSTLLAHLAVRHCIQFPGARVCIARRSLPDLKRTIWKEVLDHMSEDFVEGKDYTLHRTDHIITLRNGSEIITATWADKRYKKFRSLRLSMVLFEEIVENNDEDMEAFKQLKARLRRIKKVPQNLLMAATNPDAPSHWVYKYFIEPNSNGSKHPYRYVFYSKTDDNPFLDQAYVRQLREDFSPKEAERYLDGKWNELKGEVIYYEYDSERQYRKNIEYAIDPAHQIGITFDFNIGEGKPMSAILFQYIDDTFHFFGEVVIQGARTAGVIEEMEGRDLLPTIVDEKPTEYLITGDAAGKHRDTRSSRSDYDIIMHELSGRGLRYIYGVPPSNPPLRTRHNRVNAYCRNSLGQTRLYFYKGCETADEGMRLVKLKKGGDYIEDDSKAYQHITTAIGYAIVFCMKAAKTKAQGTVML